METRIRVLRRRQNLTLQQLADRIGTTAQTVQRLETANMRVSTDWLTRLAGALGVSARDLIAEDKPDRAVPILATLAGTLPSMARADPDGLTLDIPARNPVAVRLDDARGVYPAGSYLVGDRLDTGDVARAHGRDCIVQLSGRRLTLQRVVISPAAGIVMVPPDAATPAPKSSDFVWAAPVFLQLRYMHR